MEKKKRIGIGIAIILVAGTIASLVLLADNDKITYDTAVLPPESRLFISGYYPETTVAHIKIEKNLWGIKGYDVILTNGVNIEFNRSGNWKEVEGHLVSIPKALIPTDIFNYVRKNFADQVIVSIEKERRTCHIKLNNGLELSFDPNGNLKEID